MFQNESVLGCLDQSSLDNSILFGSMNQHVSGGCMSSLSYTPETIKIKRLPKSEADYTGEKDSRDWSNPFVPSSDKWYAPNTWTNAPSTWTNAPTDNRAINAPVNSPINYTQNNYIIKQDSDSDSDSDTDSEPETEPVVSSSGSSSEPVVSSSDPVVSSSGSSSGVIKNPFLFNSFSSFGKKSQFGSITFDPFTILIIVLLAVTIFYLLKTKKIPSFSELFS